MSVLPNLTDSFWALSVSQKGRLRSERERSIRVNNFSPPRLQVPRSRGQVAVLISALQLVVRREICAAGLPALVDVCDDENVALAQVLDDAPRVGGDLPQLRIVELG